MTARVAAGAWCVAMVLSLPVAAQAQGVPDLEGGWVRIDAEGSGSFGGLAASFPRAVLTPQAAAQQKANAAPPPRFDYARDPSQPKPPGEAYIVTDGNCRLPSGVEPNSAAFHIVQSRDQVLILRENPDPGRRVFLDGRGHPDPRRWTPTAVGHSIGRYEKGELVIESVGLIPGNVAAGGLRSAETRLIERYRLSADGTRLTITYTWQDPKIYVKPHTYSIQMDRIPPGGYAFEWWCDSSDPAQKQSVKPPEQRQ
jgi:hypothetical protein